MALKRTNGKRNNVKYLIASHGEYAAGLASAVRRLAGENPDVTALCAYTDEVPLETHMQNIMAGHEAETWIIMTETQLPPPHRSQSRIDSQRAETGRNKRSGR